MATIHSSYKVFLLGLACLTARTAEQDCPAVTVLNEYYVQDAPFCNDASTLEFHVYEDAPTNEYLFEVEEGYSLKTCADIMTDGQQIGFGFIGDAEDAESKEKVCIDFIEPNGGGDDPIAAFFVFIDVNEFAPEPADGLGVSQSIDVDENKSGRVYQFNYTDQDAEEVDTLTVSYGFEGDAADIFEINEVGVFGDVKMFEIVAVEEIDYEVNSFFSLQATFESKDPRGNSSSVPQSFLVFVQDLADNPPFFTVIVPSTTLQEEQEDVLVFQVTAIDGDVSIDNEIKYAIISGNEDEYFRIDDSTGEVFTDKVIDRETLDSTLFTLEIQATEVDDSTPEPASASQFTNVNIEDINDNEPTFQNESFSISTEEFEENSLTQTKNLDITIIVQDLDEGLSGQYDLTSSNENVLLNPVSGSGVTTFSITLRNSDDFNYEQRADDPFISVTITATEQDDDTHFSSLNMTIELLDINDNVPEFGQESYDSEVEETIPEGTSIGFVDATDGDFSSEFNGDSFVYSISGCDEFRIDERTGEVLLDEGEALNFEDQREISCIVGVEDMNGTSDQSLGSTVSFTVTVLDVNDEAPLFINFNDNIEIDEGTESSTEVLRIEVEDVDTSASVVVSLNYPENPGDEVESWFKLEEIEGSTNGNYVGSLVIDAVPDREVASEVVIEFEAVDDNADTQDQVTTRTLTVTVADVNDETPQFVSDYSDLSYSENTQEGVVVVVIEAVDPDLEDDLQFSIEDEAEFLDINGTSGEVFVLNPVDREEVSSFEVDVFVRDLVNHTQSVHIIVTVDDVNDNTPVLDDDICADSYSVVEDDEDGTLVVVVTATDEDEGVHAQISYRLANLNTPDDEQFAPFVMDIDTGEISVNTSGNLVLDRELKSKWQLTVLAYDNCDVTEPFCNNNNDECVVDVIVIDVNDNAPQNYKTNDDIVTDEFLLLGQFIEGLEVSAIDPDEPNTDNSRIDFELVFMWDNSGSEVDPPLLEAVTYNRTSADGSIIEYYCNLRATTNLTGLRGDYTIQIMGTDFGEKPLSSLWNCSVTIKDANDMSPQFSFSECLESNELQITMTENITEVGLPLNCNADDVISNPAYIYITDNDDPSTSNAEVTLSIDYEESTVVSGGPENQLTAFDVYTYSQKGRFAITINEVIDREKGSEYNLSLVARDKGEVPLVTYSWFYIVVLDYSEYDPTFCDSYPCEQTLYIKENSNETTQFKEAEDKDNEGDDQINDVVYYSIISSDVEAFFIPDNEVPEIRPKSPLDRENIGSYEMVVWASNSAVDPPPNDIENTNRVLTIYVVILDVNDETPTFDDIIYGDFLDTGNREDQVALLEFEDKDLNDTITYTFGSKFVWSEGQNYTDPFEIRALDDRRSEIILTMDPEGKTGYCTVTVDASDEGGHSSSSVAQIFVVTNDFLVPFYFYNNIDDVDRQKDYIESIFTDVFNYTSIIDSIEKAVNSNNQELEGQTIVLAHFIRQISSDEQDRQSDKQQLNTASSPRKGDNAYDSEARDSDHSVRNSVVNFKGSGVGKLVESNRNRFSSHNYRLIKNDVDYELVPESEIEKLGSSGIVASELYDQLQILGLNLVRIGETEAPDGEDKDQQIVNLKITIGSITLFLGLLVILIMIMFYIKTSKLNRQLKVMSTATVDSKNDNNFGMEVEQVPGSNLFSKEGTNPMFNFPDDELKKVTKDTDSVSWDSVLVGVEDNPEFMEYLRQRAEIGNQGLEAPPGLEPPKELQPSSAEPSFENVQKVNPLENSSENEFPDLPESEKKSEDGSQNADDDITDLINSQFSFK